MKRALYARYLCHKDKAKHKYIAKVTTANGKIRYFYDSSSYQSYLKNYKSRDDYIKETDVTEYSNDYDSFTKKTTTYNERKKGTNSANTITGNSISKKTAYKYTKESSYLPNFVEKLTKIPSSKLTTIDGERYIRENINF